MNEPLNSRWLRWSLTCIAGLLFVIAIELSALSGPLIPRAQAQVPDSGAQRLKLLAENKKTNALLDQILQHLRTQTVKVKVIGTDKDNKSTSKAKPRAARR